MKAQKRRASEITLGTNKKRKYERSIWKDANEVFPTKTLEASMKRKVNNVLIPTDTWCVDLPLKATGSYCWRQYGFFVCDSLSRFFALFPVNQEFNPDAMERLDRVGLTKFEMWHCWYAFINDKTNQISYQAFQMGLLTVTRKENGCSMLFTEKVCANPFVVLTISAPRAISPTT